MPAYKKIVTNAPSERERILVAAHLEYRHVFQDLGNASYRLAAMYRSLEKGLSEGEGRPYILRIVEQRGAIHACFQSMLYTFERVFPRWVQTPPLPGAKKSAKKGRA